MNADVTKLKNIIIRVYLRSSVDLLFLFAWGRVAAGGKQFCNKNARNCGHWMFNQVG